MAEVIFAGLDEQQLAGLSRIWTEGIPLARYMGIELGSLDAQGLRLRVPLAPSRNHMGTAFAGALQAAMTLTGWGLTAALLVDEPPGDIVAQASSVQFLEPVRADFETFGAIPDAGRIERFHRQYRKRGRARLLLSVETLVEGRRRAAAEIRYAAIRHS